MLIQAGAFYVPKRGLPEGRRAKRGGDINNGVKMFKKEKRNQKFDVLNKVKKKNRENT